MHSSNANDLQFIRRILRKLKRIKVKSKRDSTRVVNMLDALQMVDAKKAPIIARVGERERDESRLLIHLTNTARRGFSPSFLPAKPSRAKTRERMRGKNN
jgi:hypothetical protein